MGFSIPDGNVLSSANRLDKKKLNSSLLKEIPSFLEPPIPAC
jgi:hypothetical protein